MMKKIVAYLLISLMAITVLPAQSRHKNYHKNTKSVDKTVFFGIVGGATAPSFSYSDKNLSGLPKEFTVGPNAGIFVEIPVTKIFAISPEIMWASKGYKTSYEYGKNDEGAPYNVTYQVKSSYASLRIPLIFSYPINNTVQPFLFVAPDFSYLLGGNISLSQPGLSIPEANVNIGSANMKNIDASAYFGLGVRLKFRFSDYFTLLTRIDLGYNMGFINTYSDAEIAESAATTNVNAYNINGTRMNRGFELNIHIGFPIRKNECGCDDINKKYRTSPKAVKKKYKIVK